MIRLFFAALLPSLLAVIMLPALAHSSRPPVQQRQPPVPPAAASVGIGPSSFDPAAVTIKPGETVAWENSSDRDHQIVADEQHFKSGTIKPGKSWRHTFESPGTYRYHCALHPRAKGTVKVEP